MWNVTSEVATWRVLFVLRNEVPGPLMCDYIHCFSGAPVGASLSRGERILIKNKSLQREFGRYTAHHLLHRLEAAADL